MHRLVRLILTAALLLIPAPDDSAAVPQSERDALIALYTATGGEAWTNKSGWLGASGTECTWFGVVCDSTQSHVTGVTLRTNGVRGTLPAQVAQLTRLEKLDLYWSSLSDHSPWKSRA